MNLRVSISRLSVSRPERLGSASEAYSARWRHCHGKAATNMLSQDRINFAQDDTYLLGANLGPHDIYTSVALVCALMRAVVRMKLSSRPRDSKSNLLQTTKLAPRPFPLSYQCTLPYHLSISFHPSLSFFTTGEMRPVNR